MFEEYADNFNNMYERFPQGKLFRLTFDPVVNMLQITAKRQDMFSELQDAFSTVNPAEFFSRQYGYKVDTKLYLVNKFGYFQSGLLFDVMSWIKNTYGSLDCIAISKNCKSYIDDVITPLKSFIKEHGMFEISNIAEDLGRNSELRISGKTPYTYRDYQKGAVEALISKGFGRGLIEIPTAGGKSFIISNFIWNCIKNINRKWKTLILVPNTSLVTQFYKDLMDYGFDKKELAIFTGKMTKAQMAENDVSSAKIVISNRQYIFKNKERLPKFDILFCDEAHTVTGSTMEFVNKLDCKIKVGCTGTIPKVHFDRMNLIGIFGKIVYKEEITKLQERGFISKLKITLLKIKVNSVENNPDLLFHVNSNKKYKPDEFGYSDVKFNDAVNAENDYFMNNYKDLYSHVFEYVKSLNSNTLILFDRIEIGENLYQYANELYKNKNVFYIDGRTSSVEREQIRNDFEKCDGNLLFAQSAVFSTGVNIKRLTNLIFLTGSKSFSRVVQSIGRTLRLHESKTEAHLIDISWNFKYSQKHLSERLAIYQEQYHKKYDEVLNFEI